MKTALFVALAILTALFVLAWTGAIRREQARTGGAAGPSRPTLGQTLLGFVTNFFDTLGIGSFAPTATVFRWTRMVPDRSIPGTMNVGHTLPVVVMAYIYIATVEVEVTTLVALISASVVGAWFGAGIVARLPRRPIQVGIGCALLVAAALMVIRQLDSAPAGGTALGLSAGPLILATLCSVLLGALNTIGVGFYGPCMILVALLGMDPKAAFPIMMGSCAFLMPVGSTRFVRTGAYSMRPALGLAVGGVPAVPIAALLVRSLPLDELRWLVIVVAAYTAVTMLRPGPRGDPIKAGSRA